MLAQGVIWLMLISGDEKYLLIPDVSSEPGSFTRVFRK
jgi:hypothetical protein